MATFNTSYVHDTTDDPERYPSLELATAVISKWFRVITITLGIPGNVIAFLVTTKKDNRYHSACTYMAALALCDNVVLLQRVLYVSLINIDAQFLTNKLFLSICWYLAGFGGVSSSLCLAEMTMDRAFMVVYPMKARRVCSASKARKVVIVTVVIQALVYINEFFTYEISHPGMMKRSVPKAPWVGVLFDYYELIFGALFPFIVIAVCNTIIVFAVKRAAQKRKHMSSTDVTSPHNSAQERNITRMLIFVSVAFLFCQVPLRMYENVLAVPGVLNMYDGSSRY